jgi:proline racemase
MDSSHKHIRGVIFIDQLEVEIIIEYQQQNRKTVKEQLSCYHVQEEALDEDVLRNVQIIEIEGEREVEGPSLESKVFVSPIKVNKINIGTTNNPKMANIGDYWDE